MKLRAVSLFAVASLLASSAFAQLTQSGNDVMIGGFIVQGTGPKTVIVRAIGPELTPFGIPNALADPTLELHNGAGALIASNDNWQTTVIGGIITSNQVSAIQDSGHPPTQPSESAIIATLPPGNYTAIVRGKNSSIGVALVEAYDLNPNTTSVLGNISTRALVQTGNDVMIGGFIVQGAGPKRVIVRGIGPELTPFGIPNALADPILELHNGAGALIASNDNWQTTVIGGIITSNQVSAIQDSGHPPTQPSESAIIATLPPGNYTAIVRGKNNSIGVALVEVYDLDPDAGSILGNISTRASVASDVQTMPFGQLTASDVQTIINHAVTRAVTISPNSVIAVTDREGDVLGVWVMRGDGATPPEIATAVSKAGTAAYLSSNQNAFTSRTAGFIIQQHFPPGVINAAPGPLVGVGLSNLFFSDINKFRGPDSVILFSPTPGTDNVPGTNEPAIKLVFGSSLDGTPGGVPLYKNGQLVGGLGVTGDGIPGPIPGFRAENPFIFIAGYDKDEDIALAGQHGYSPASAILATNVFINGLRLPYVNSSTIFSNVTVPRGNADSRYPILGTPVPFPYPVATLGGVSGQIRQPIQSDPRPGTINGQPRLTAAEVTSILSRAAHETCITRAGIRLPIGVSMKAFITVVNNPNEDGMAPTVLGTFRTGEATLFSWDVAVQKARTVIFYSRHDFLNFGVKVAMSVRCVGFLAQCNYPPGIDGNPQGPFNGEQERFTGLLGNHCNPVGITVKPGVTFPPDPNLPNGITIFPGAFGLYRNGVLVGAIGISGDGVDQDDLAGAAGCHDFLAPFAIRSDEFFLRGTRLPYAKFPRDPAISCQ
jgi:uncharacterized protein GlcG (DUF336 family)